MPLPLRPPLARKSDIRAQGIDTTLNPINVEHCLFKWDVLCTLDQGDLLCESVTQAGSSMQSAKVQIWQTEAPSWGVTCHIKVSPAGKCKGCTEILIFWNKASVMALTEEKKKVSYRVQCRTQKLARARSAWRLRAPSKQRAELYSHPAGTCITCCDKLEYLRHFSEWPYNIYQSAVPLRKRAHKTQGSLLS